MTTAKDPCADPTTAYGGLPALVEWGQLHRDHVGDHFHQRRFIFDRVLDSVRFVTDGLLISPDFEIDAFNKLYAAHAGLSFQDMVRLAGKVITEFQTEVGATAQRLTPSSVGGVQIGGLGRGPVSGALGSAYIGMNFDNTTGIHVQWTTPPPAAASHTLMLGIAIAKDSADRFPFVVFDWDNPSDRVDIRLEDVYPVETTDLIMRRAQFAERKLRGAL